MTVIIKKCTDNITDKERDSRRTDISLIGSINTLSGFMTRSSVVPRMKMTFVTITATVQPEISDSKHSSLLHHYKVPKDVTSLQNLNTVRNLFSN